MMRWLPLLALLLWPAAVSAKGFACDLTAFTPAERTVHATLTKSLLEVSQRRELRDGLALRLPAERWADAAQWVAGERRCCPFLRFELVSEAGAVVVELRVTGARGVKAFLEAELSGEDACP
jgi:hypothetical protein